MPKVPKNSPRYKAAVKRKNKVKSGKSAAELAQEEEARRKRLRQGRKTMPNKKKSKKK